MDTHRKNRARLVALITAIVFLLFSVYLWGIFTIRSQIFPYDLLKQLYASVKPDLQASPNKALASPDSELLKYAFVDPVSSPTLIHPPISSLKDLRRKNERIFVSRDGFDQAYNKLKIVATHELNSLKTDVPIIAIDFEYQDKDYQAFAYGVLPKHCGRDNVSALIIPGSGHNHSRAIATNDPENYHFGIIDVLHNFSISTYVLIKPNEDALAWHNGMAKISGDFIWNWHLNRGGSYSVSYLVQAMAIQKYLSSCYRRTVIAGLSQGGAASLLVASQANPDLAIVASGASLIKEDVEWSGHNQLIAVPTLSSLYEPHALKKLLETSQTKYLFSWGKKEVGTYKIEAEEQITANVISPLPNVSVSIHDDGHVFHVPSLISFLKEHL